MKFKVGDIVSCPPSGPHAGRRIGKIIEFSNTCGKDHLPALIKYIDYPQRSFLNAWVSGISLITLKN